MSYFFTYRKQNCTVCLGLVLCAIIQHLSIYCPSFFKVTGKKRHKKPPNNQKTHFLINSASVPVPIIFWFSLHRFLWKIYTVNGDTGVSNRTWAAAMPALYSQSVDNFIKKKGGWRGGEIWIIFLVIWFTTEKVIPCKKRQSSLWVVWGRSRNGRAKMGGTLATTQLLWGGRAALLSTRACNAQSMHAGSW